VQHLAEDADRVGGEPGTRERGARARVRDVAAVDAGERCVEAELERERLRAGKHATRAQRHVHAASDELLDGDAIGAAHVARRAEQGPVDVADEELVARGNCRAQAEAGGGYTETRFFVRLACS
jgi:hypothetical protein